ncbi:isopentenyl transferase family protein [Streptomyces nanshensis]|uniref:isopentenyl transferase family protein n=1 Tax=Streptomyces nanshensis TaxID=518642 RepID=UPI00085BBA49|nr:isopentenyl transferase family protein [Streptomyces nanshensis]
MDLILLLGPTGSGKTARSVRLARRLGAPVVTLDRVQCAPQLAVGSGRPEPDELSGTRRIYLADRPVDEGILPGAEAADRLEQLLEEHAALTPTLILEGGSISILGELANRPAWTHGHTIHIEPCLEENPQRYEQRVSKRVAHMLGYGSGTHRTMLDELADLWPHENTRPHLQTVLGYDDIITVCVRYGIDPASLTGPEGRILRYVFADTIVEAHLHYSRQQRLHIAAMLPLLALTGGQVKEKATRRRHGTRVPA